MKLLVRRRIINFANNASANEIKESNKFDLFPWAILLSYFSTLSHTSLIAKKKVCTKENLCRRKRVGPPWSNHKKMK
jgi:hypothetical protein